MVINIAGYVRRWYYDPVMAADPYGDAIKAFARLAIAAGAEPSGVQVVLGPHAKCDRTWARQRPINQLAATAGTAAEAIGLTFEFHFPEGSVNTQKFFTDLELREQFAATAIECGAAIRDMCAAMPAHRRSEQRQANRAVTDEFTVRSGQLEYLSASIAKQVAHVLSYVSGRQLGGGHVNQTEFLKACRRLVETLDEHDATVRRLHRLAHNFRWRALPGTTAAVQGRRAFTAKARLNRDDALSASAAIRAWVLRASPGPL